MQEEFIYELFLTLSVDNGSIMNHYGRVSVPQLRTPSEVALELGRRVQSLRLARDWRRATLAERAGVGLSTVQRFESTGHITVDNLLKIASALGRLAELEQLFDAPAARSLAELERAASAREQPKRGRR